MPVKKLPIQYLLILLFLFSGILHAAEQEFQRHEIIYISKTYEEPPPLSLLEKILTDDGVQGAKLAVRNSNLTGRLLKHKFELKDEIVDDGSLLDVFKSYVASGHTFFILDLKKKDLLELATLQEAKNVFLFNIKAEENELRTEVCYPNLFHIVPSSAMRTDALAQYLIWKKWRKWFVLSGKYPSDKAYTQSIKRSAKRFGGKIVDERSYKLETGNNRVDSGHQQIQTQMPMLTRNAREHDVIFVADENESFGLYLPYRTAEPRPVVGTYGLTASAWHRSYEQYAGTQMQNSFEKFSGRVMTEKDYLAWLALKLISKTIMQGSASDNVKIRSFMMSENLNLAAYKGRPLTFRKWNQQMRQPLILSSARALVSMAPLDEFLHPRFYTDTLGFDVQDSQCRLNK